MPEIAALNPPADVPEALPAMGFLDHLEELRKRIFYCLIAVVVGFFSKTARFGQKLFFTVTADDREVVIHEKD